MPRVLLRDWVGRLQVTVSFGGQALKWYEAEEKQLDMTSAWKVALKASRKVLIGVFNEWDKTGRGVVTKKQFRKGIAALGLKVSWPLCMSRSSLRPSFHLSVSQPTLSRSWLP